MPEQSTMPLVHIYLLLDPISFLPRYVGQTRHPQTRLRDHLADRQHSYKVHWIQKMRSAGQTPLFEVIDVVSLERADDEERFWIGALRNAGHNLVNGTTGGGNGFALSAEARARISAAAKGRKGQPITPDHRARLNAGRKHRPLSDAHRAKMRIALSKPRGPHSAERRANISAANRGRVFTPEWKAKIGESQRGKPHNYPKIRKAPPPGRKLTPEQRARIAEVWRGRTHTPETKAKMVESALAQRNDPEYRARMSQSCKAAWVRRREAAKGRAAIHTYAQLSFVLD